MTKTIKRKDFLRIVREVCGDEHPELIKSAKKQTNTCYQYAGVDGSHCLVGWYISSSHLLAPRGLDSEDWRLSRIATNHDLTSVGERFSHRLMDHFLGDLGHFETVIITKNFKVVHRVTGEEYKVRLPMDSTVGEVNAEYLRKGYPKGDVYMRVGSTGATIDWTAS